MADKLELYNEALGHLEERRIRSLAEACERRRVLDDFWLKAVAYCLERRFWNFSYRTVRIEPDESITPEFGFKNAFTIPTDWIRTRLCSASPQLTPPLLNVREEAGFWYADVTPLYVQYNSNHATYGMDLARWLESFSSYVALRLARLACKRVTGSDNLLEGPNGLIRQEEKAGRVAGATCAMNDPIGFAPRGRWVTSRQGGGRGDDPQGGSLIG